VSLNSGEWSPPEKAMPQTCPFILQKTVNYAKAKAFITVSDGGGPSSSPKIPVSSPMTVASNAPTPIEKLADILGSMKVS